MDRLPLVERMVFMDRLAYRILHRIRPAVPQAVQAVVHHHAIPAPTVVQIHVASEIGLNVGVSLIQSLKEFHAYF